MERATLETLSELPLFQGMRRDELENFCTSVPHSWNCYEAGRNMAVQDESCRQLIIACSGTVRMCTQSDDKRYTFQERLHSPLAVQPEALYGIHPRYGHTFTAQTDVQALVIPKESVTHLFAGCEVFRLNIINLLSTQIYRSRRWMWHDLSGNTEMRIITFFRTHSTYPAGEKILEISMEELGRQINEPRKNISIALNGLQKKNLLLLQRRRIIVPMLEKLLQNP